ncbi:MAG: heat-inducible transcription repressor HrcA [Candidatus Tectomicrobia bacterium]|nr:heat-inducible transcription repressor HrcA [Candidatus Tectomicrobia bacterium]
MNVNISERTKDVLRTLIQMYLLTGEPVSSRSLAHRLPLGLSPASIRNIMANLEDLGYLHHSHTSAGRMPTDQAYRFYVDDLKALPSLPRSYLRQINRLYEEKSRELTEVLNTASCILSQLSQQLGIVLASTPPDEVYRHITFVRLRPGTVLGIFVTEAGAVYRRQLQLDADLCQEKLNTIANYLNEEFVGYTLSKLRDELLAKMRLEKAQYDALMQRAIELCELVFAEDEKETGAEVYVEGILNFMEQPEFRANIEKMRLLLSTFEERGLVLKLIERCLQVEGVCVTIGSENDLSEMQDCAIITRAYTHGSQVRGVLGILGSKRLLYPRMISLVDYTASVVSNVLSGAVPHNLAS